jgi:hypothetical protein
MIQAGYGSVMATKVGSGNGKNHSGSTTLPTVHIQQIPYMYIQYIPFIYVTWQERRSPPHWQNSRWKNRPVSAFVSLLSPGREKKESSKASLNR